MSSNSDSEDSDFVPDLEQDDSEDSVHSEPDNEEEEEDPDETEKKSGKRKGAVKRPKSKKSRSKRRRRASSDTDEDKSDLNDEETSKDDISKLSEEERKSKVDSLWNDFLSDVAVPPKKSTSSAVTQSTSEKSEQSKAQTTTTNDEPSEVKETPKQDKTTTVTAVTKVEAEESKPKEASSSSTASVGSEKKTLTQLSSNITRPGVRRSGGISSILNSISKKPKISVLEKSKLDWNEFKQQNNLSEEITTFNRGKNGYLERQDFLQRTDSRQFEMEKEMRSKNRKKL